MMKRVYQSVALITMLALVPALVFSQVATGTPPFGSFTGGPDVINLSDLNIHWSIPVVAKAGRGIPFHYVLSFDNSVWKVVNINGQNTWQPGNTTMGWNTMGWQRQTEGLTGYITYDTTTPGCGTVYSNWVYHDQGGTAHRFSNVTVSNPAGCAGNPFSAGAVADDGSGLQIMADAAPTGTVYPTSGGYIKPPLQSLAGLAQIADTNGNFLGTSDGISFVDTMGQTVMTVDNSLGNPAFPVAYHYRAVGGDKQVTVGYGAFNIQSNFGCTGIAEYGPAQIWLLTSVNYPDGSSYTFQYETTPGFSGSSTGRLAKVTLPTGGSISYDYYGAGIGCGSNVGINSDGMTAAFTRTANDGANNSVSTFWLTDRGGTGQGSTHASVYTSPTNYNETVLNFSGNFETQRQIYQGPAPPTTGGTLLETVLTCYNNNFTNCATATVTPPIASKVFYNTFPGGLGDAHGRIYNSYGLLTEANEYDFTTGSFGTPTARKIITYKTDLGLIIDRPATVTIEDGATPPNVLEQTTYSYDESAVVSTAGNTPAVPGHGTPPGTRRANVTTISSLVAGTTFLSKHFTYFDTGTPATATDVNGAVTTYNYPSSDPTNLSCGYAFPTSVSPPTVGGITLTTSATYNCDGGVAVTTTDPNGNSKSVTSWDANFWRPTQVQDELGNLTNISYTHAVASPFTPAVVESTFTFNAGNSIIDSRTTLDALGRTHIVQRKQSPTATNYDSVETDYDSYGRASLTTTAYAGTAGQSYCSSHGLPSSCTPAGTSTVYDALNRPTQVTSPPQVSDSLSGAVTYLYTNNDVLITLGPTPSTETNSKQRQYEYDALGRLTSVCEVTSGSGSGNCAQSNSKTGYWTKYAYDAAGRLTNVTQNAQAATGSQQTRTFVYDRLGRVTSEANPETGTVSYVYDVAATPCTPAYPQGNLIRSEDAAGNVICRGYDLLHRLAGYGTVAGPATGSAYKYFVFDTATVNGQAMSNGKGRLVEAYTQAPSGGAKITDEGFSYTARGETTDVYESTTHSGGYYHVTAGYWPHGALKSWTMPGVPTITYGATDGSGLDGEGRFTKVNAATGINPVNSVSYNNVDPGTSNQPLGALLSASLGTTTTGQYDTDSFSYDKNTGRLTNYTFSVGNPAQTDVGQLTWNANGSLRTLQITDAVSGSIDTQTCNYTHDDLGRIASVDCGNTTWQQNFSYDPFGNITKTVPTGGTGVSFQPTYSNPPTNRITSTGYVYDNGVANGNGNLTNDTIHTYSWDAEGRLTCIDGIVMTYDAMGRAVEQATGGTCASPGTSYKQIVYGADGGKLTLMNAQTLVKAFVPLPGGATAVYTPSGLAYYRHSDHLGSSRLATTPSRTSYFTGAYAPFGENYKENGTADRSFTEQNQDTVSGLYDFMFREDSPNQGRWISPDPAGLAAVSMTNPQSWNRYGYVANRPLTSIDPLGLCDDAGNNCDTPWGSKGGGDLSGIGGFGPASGRGIREPLLATDGTGEGGGDGGNGNGSSSCWGGIGPPAQGQSRCPWTTCPAASFKVTGIAPGQAPDNTAITLTPRASIPNGGVAIKPRNFGVRGINGGNREVFKGILLYPNWSFVSIPSGLPSQGPYFPVDNIGPASVRNEPGNQIDIYNFPSFREAWTSTRTIPVVAVIPPNTVGVTCPK